MAIAALASYSLAIGKDLDHPQHQKALERPIILTLTPITISDSSSYRCHMHAPIGPGAFFGDGETVPDLIEFRIASADSTTNWSTVRVVSPASDFPEIWTTHDDSHSYGFAAYTPVSVRTISWSVDAGLPRTELANTWSELWANWSTGQLKPAIKWTIGDDFESSGFVETKLSGKLRHNDNTDCRAPICIGGTSKLLTLKPNSDQGGSILGVMTVAPQNAGNAASVVTGGCLSSGTVLTI